MLRPEAPRIVLFAGSAFAVSALVPRAGPSSVESSSAGISRGKLFKPPFLLWPGHRQCAAWAGGCCRPSSFVAMAPCAIQLSGAIIVLEHGVVLVPKSPAPCCCWCRMAMHSARHGASDRSCWAFGHAEAGQYCGTWSRKPIKILQRQQPHGSTRSGAPLQPEGCACRQGQRHGGRRDVTAPPPTIEHRAFAAGGC